MVLARDRRDMEVQAPEILSDNDTFKVVSEEGTSDEISLQRF